MMAMPAWRRSVAYARVIAVAFELTLKMMANDMFLLFAIVVQPLMLAFMGLWMLRDTLENYAIFVVIGTSMTGLWSSLLFISSASIMVERWNRTLEPLAAVPTPLAVIVFGKNLAYVAQWLASTVFSYVVISLVLGYPLSVSQPGIFAVSVALTVGAFLSFGLLLGTIFLIKPEFMQWRNGLEYPIYLLAGFLFPIALLPGWTTPFSYLLSPYWAARILHASTSGAASWGEALLDWGMLLLFSAVYLALASRLFRRALHKVRVDATLSQY